MEKKEAFFRLIGTSKFLLAVIILLIPLTGCQKFEVEKTAIHSGNYSGTYESYDNLIITRGSVFLNISNGKYFCYTNGPFDYGAGNWEVSRSSIFFKDTLFFPVPALYTKRYAPAGKFYFQYDGENLIMWKVTKLDRLNYRLRKEEE